MPYTVQAIGPGDMAAGFALAGVPVMEVSSTDEGVARLAEALGRDDIGVLLADESIIKAMPEDLRRRALRKPTPVLVPVSLSTVVIGLLVLTTRSKALTQVVGYLILENGIYVFGLSQVERVPFLVEVGVLLDVFVGVFIMGIVVFHINREFDSLDSARLTELRD